MLNTVAPIRMRWKLKDEKVTDSKSNDDIDVDLFVDLQANPIRARSYPERVLILTGLSQNWNRPAFKPCLKLDDKGRSHTHTPHYLFIFIF